MLKRFLSILFAITVSSSFAEPIYKGFVINGNTVYQWVRVDTVHEYDSNGKVIHEKDSKGYEGWWEYDANGNKTHYKDSDGDEKWWDGNGKLIHWKKPDVWKKFDGDDEEWWEYDSHGNEIHWKNSNGDEKWWEYEYNEDGVMVKATAYKPI